MNFLNLLIGGGALTKKGVSLPVNVVIIVLIAILVLALVTGFFITTSGESEVAIGNAGTYSDLCTKFRANGYCGNSITPDDDFLEACENFFGTQNNCKEKCCGQEIPTPTSTPTCYLISIQKCDDRDDCRICYENFNTPVAYCCKVAVNN